MVLFNKELFILDFYEKIQYYITAKKVNKTALAKEIGITVKTVHNLGKGTSIETYFKIIKALGMSPSDFFTDKKENDYKKVTGLAIVHEEGAVSGIVDYKEKYYEALEKLDNVNNKLNEANERLLAFMDVKKEVIKKGK